MAETRPFCECCDRCRNDRTCVDFGQTHHGCTHLPARPMLGAMADAALVLSFREWLRAAMRRQPTTPEPGP